MTNKLMLKLMLEGVRDRRRGVAFNCKRKLRIKLIFKLLLNGERD